MYGGRFLLLLAAAALTAACSSDGQAVEYPDGVALLVNDGDESRASNTLLAPALLVVTDDGRVIYSAPAGQARAGLLLADVWEQSLTTAGVALVDEAVARGAAPEDLAALSTVVGDELGDVSFFLPDRYDYVARVLGPAQDFSESENPVIDWPQNASRRLRDEGCFSLPDVEVGELFETAAADSVFVDDGFVYVVNARLAWPGLSC